MSIAIAILIVATVLGMIYRHQKVSNRPAERLIKAVRQRAENRRPANDNAKQSFVYQVEKRRPTKR
jgi:hypothetical protein